MKRKIDYSLDPLSRVYRTPLVTADGVETDKHAIMLKPENTEPIHVGTVSNDYILVPNSEVRNIAQDVFEVEGLDYEKSECLFNGKRYSEKYRFPSLTIEPEKGDVINWGVEVFNSYDGSTRHGFSIYMERLICANGMIGSELFSSFRFRHFGEKNNDYKNEVESAGKFISHIYNSNLQKIGDRINLLKKDTLNIKEIQKVFEYLNRHYDQIDSKLLGNAFMLLEGDRMLDIYNAFTNYLSHNEKKKFRDDRLNARLTNVFLGQDFYRLVKEANN